MDEGTLVLLYFLAIGALALSLAVWVFRMGTRDRFISRKPFLKLAFWTIGLLVLVWLADWLIGKEQAFPLHIELLIAVAVGAGAFMVAATIWLAGFAYGRWRASRSDGVISRNRRPTR
jgi:hypothetical protein